MSGSSNVNTLSQSLDIKGSETINANKTLADEQLGLGGVLAGGSGATLTGISGGGVVIAGLSGITADSVGRFVTLTGSSISGNNGTFPVTQYISSSSFAFTNSSVTLPDVSSLSWMLRTSYSLADDLNFERTDRQLIKGVAFYAPIPTYTRPTATSTNVDANLANIASKTTDARGFIVNRKFYNVLVQSGDQQTTVTETGQLRHSDAVNKTGVPAFNSGPYSGNYLACYAEVLDGYTDGELLVLSGGHAGEKIFALTEATLSTSPDSIDVVYFSCPIGQDVSIQSTAYMWEVGQTTSVTVIYGYFQQLDLIADEALRVTLSGGGGGSTPIVQSGYNLLNSLLFGGM